MITQRHQVGLKANFSIPVYLLDHASSAGVEITRIRKNEYQIKATKENALENILPDFMHGKNTVDLATLKQFLEFLHQPIRLSVGENKRAAVNKFLTLISSGVTTDKQKKDAVPGYLEEDEHVEVEDSIKEKDLWHEGAEIGRHSAGYGAIPHSWVDSMSGQFVLQIDNDFINKNPDVSNILKKYATIEQGKIVVNACELQSLCKALAADESIERIISCYEPDTETPEMAVAERKPLHKLFVAATVDTTRNFVMDIYSFMRESPAMAGTALAVAGALYWVNGDTASVATVAQDVVVLLGEEGPTIAAIDPSSLSEAARNVQSWHYDMGPFGLYKHYMYNNAVIGPTQSILDGIRIGTHWIYEQAGIAQNFDNHFSKSAEETVKPIADALFKINIFQNFTHAGFWMYMFGKGVNHGFRGAEKIIKLFEPLSDLGKALYVRSKEALGLQKPASVYKEPEKLPMNGLRLAWCGVAGVALSVPTISVGMDMAGQVHPVTDMISAMSGHVAATGVTGATFLAYNFVEDILAVHMAGGAALLTAGTAFHYAWNRAARPVISTIAEYRPKLIELDYR